MTGMRAPGEWIGGWRYWLATIAVLALGCAMGAVWPEHFLAMLKPSILHIERLARHLHAHHSTWLSIWTVFLNNLRVALLMVVLGLFAGVFPVFTMWTNGLMMGLVTVTVAEHAHVAAWKVAVAGELPHGVFELTALCWASVSGLRLAVAAVSSISGMLGKHSSASYTDEFGVALRVQNTRALAQEAVHALERIPFIMAILFVAACIEILVTPHVMAAFGV